MKVDVKNSKGDKVDTTELPSQIFEAPILEDLMHQALMRQMANARLGTHKTKSRGEVRGGGRKPWRQKGTGRARQGSRRAPNWVGGGKVHTPRPRDYSVKMPRKMRRAALRSALSVKASQKLIVVVDKFEMASAKTAEMAKMLESLVGNSSALILLPAKDENVERSLSNLTSAKSLRANYLNVRDLLGYEQLVMPLDALTVLQSYLGK
jgi:large subunit ribosomal protein L4